MPNATVTQETVRKDLKTLPGGYVVLKMMSYGQSLVRKDMMMQMRMEAGQKGGGAKMDISLLNEEVAVFDFANCIVEHNLEDADGNTLDLKSPSAVRMLAARVGEEVGTYINELNQFEDELGK